MGKDDEILATFTPDGEPDKAMRRGDIHVEPVTVWHGVTNIWVINSKIEILCTKRSMQNEGNPGKWQTYVGGHVRNADGFDTTATRELKEEIGINVTIADLSDIGVVTWEPAKHFTKLFYFIWDGNAGDIKPVDGEIKGARWMSYEVYLQEEKEHPDQWCNGLDEDVYKKIATKTKK